MDELPDVGGAGALGIDGDTEVKALSDTGIRVQVNALELGAQAVADGEVDRLSEGGAQGTGGEGVGIHAQEEGTGDGLGMRTGGRVTFWNAREAGTVGGAVSGWFGF